MVRRKTTLAGALLVVLATIVVSAGSAAAQASSHRVSSAKGKYTESLIVRAFHAQGIGLYDSGFGAIEPVKTLSSTKSHDGWNLAVYIYVTPEAAAETYNGSIKAWRGAGMTAVVKKNVVVAVVPVNRLTIAKKGQPFSLPAVVAKTMASLPS